MDCDRSWKGKCSGELVDRISVAGEATQTCVGHLADLQYELSNIATRYPEVNHPESCSCYGCQDGSW